MIMFKFGAIFLLLLLSIVGVADAQDKDKDWTKVTLSTGTIRGKRVVTQKNNVGFAFKGVPFAEPPTGDFRYRAPKDKKKWASELDVTEYQYACMSTRKTDLFTMKPVKMSEDCLHVNIFTSEKCLTDKKCPVVYYIFGGGWTFNSPFNLGDQALVDNFNSKDIVFITVNYRLASFGFINTGDKTSAEKNLGLLDAIQGLRWTQKEIGNFGGDKGKVTIMGHSNGGEMVDMVAMSPKSDGLFHQVIVMSGPAEMFDLRKDNNEAATKALAINVGCATDDLWKTGDTLEKIITCMRKKSADELIDAQKELEDNGQKFFGPCMDGSGGVLPEPLKDLQRKRRPYRLLIGTTSKEFRTSKRILDKDGKKVNTQLLYATCVRLAKSQGFNHTIVVGRACADEYAKRPADIPDLEDDPYIYLPTYYTGEAMRAKDATIFKYSFEYDEIGAAYANTLKALGLESPFHAQDLVYVMGVIQGKFSDKDEKITQIYSGMFASFIKSGDPSPPYDGPWQPSDDRNNYFKIDFDDNLKMPGNTDGYHAAAVKFWTKTAPEIDGNFSKWDANGTFDYEKFAEDLIEGLKKMGVDAGRKVEEEIEKWKDDLQGWNKDRVERLEKMLDDLLDRVKKLNDDRKHKHRHRSASVYQNMYQVAPHIVPSVRNETIIVNGKPADWRTWFWVMTGLCILLAVVLLLTCCSTCYQNAKRQRIQRITEVSETTHLSPSTSKLYG